VPRSTSLRAGCRRGVLVRADGLHERRAELSHRQEEIFGPVLSVLTFRTPEEAVEKANNTPYGLSAGSGPRRARAFFGWRSGCAQASCGNTFNRFDPSSPFGGYKESGFGARVDATVWSRTCNRQRALHD